MQKENLHFCTWSTNYHIPCPSTHHKDTSQCQEAFFLTRSNTKLPILSFHIYIHMSHGLFLLSLIFVVASVYFDDTCCGKVFIYISFPWKKNIIKVILGPLMFLPPDLFVSLYTARFFVFFLFSFLEHICERDYYPSHRNNEKSSQNSSDLTTDIFLLGEIS